MRAHVFVFFAAIAFLLSSSAEKSCMAQNGKPAQPANAKPANPAPAYTDPAPVVIEAPKQAPQQPAQAGVAIPAMRLLPAMARGSIRNPTGLPFDLANLVLAKFDESPKGPQLVALVEQSRTEQKTVTVTRFIQEVRTRKVKVTGKDGKETEVDQQYTVAIPVTENVEQPVQVPAGKKPTTFPLDELRIYRLDGTKVTEAEARKLLEKMSPIFLLRGFTGDIKAVEGVYLQALSPNCLIVATEKAENAAAPLP